MLVDAVEVLVADIARTAATVATAVAEAAALDPAKVVLHAEDLLTRTGLLLECYEPVLTGAHRTLVHAAAMAQPHHVDSLAQLVELAPELLDLITPALRGMGQQPRDGSPRRAFRVHRSDPRRPSRCRHPATSRPRARRAERMSHPFRAARTSPTTVRPQCRLGAGSVHRDLSLGLVSVLHTVPRHNT